MKKPFSLQLFAGNANTQTTLLTAEGNNLSAEMKTFYSDYLIDMAEPELIHDQFGDEYDIPANGGKTIEFRKWDSLPKATTALTEGVTPDGNKLNVSVVTGTVAQYGDYVTLSDMLRMTAIDNVVVQALQALGSQAGRTLDTITRTVLQGGTNIYRVGKRTSRATLTAADTLTPSDIRKAANILKRMNTPKIDGKYYVMIAHPDTVSDLMGTTEWADYQKHVHPEKIYEGEVGELYGVKIVESTEAKIYTGGSGADACPSGLAVYGTLMLGGKAYAKTKLKNGGLQTIIKQLGEGGNDPLNQRSTVGWKATKTAERLVEQYMLRIEHTTSMSADAVAN